MRPPAISVCIPTFNRSKRLARVLEICLSSRCGDFEVVVSDNASSDGTDDLLRSIGDPRLRRVRQAENIGMWPNWDAAISAAAAPIVFRMDDDDYIGGEFLAKMVDLFQRRPDIGCAFSGFAYARGYDFRREGEVVDRGVFGGREVVEGHELVRAFLMQDPFPGLHTAAVVFRKELWERVGRYRTLPSDQQFALALAACGKVGYVPEVLFYYVQHFDARVSAVSGPAAYGQIRELDILAVAKDVYGSPCRELRELPEIQPIRDTVFEKHMRLYPCIHFYCTRNNYRSRWLVAYCAWRMIRKYPAVMRDPVVWAAFFAMLLLPMPWLLALMRWYRNRRG